MGNTPTRLFDQSINIIRPTAGVDGGGAPTQTFTAHLSAVMCRIHPLRGDENLIAGRLATARTYRVYLDPSLDVAATDRIVWTPSTATGATHTLQIVEPLIDFDARGLVGRLVAMEVTP